MLNGSEKCPLVHLGPPGVTPTAACDTKWQLISSHTVRDAMGSTAMGPSYLSLPWLQFIPVILML